MAYPFGPSGGDIGISVGPPAGTQYDPSLGYYVPKGGLLTDYINAPGDTPQSRARLQRQGRYNVPGLNPAGGVDTNDPTQRYRSFSLPKLPGVQSQADKFQEDLAASVDSSLQHFNDLVGQFKSQASAATASGRRAADIGPTANALTGAQGRYASALGGAVDQYGRALGESAGAERGIVGQAQSLLPEYDLSLGRAENLAQANVAGAVNRYAAGKNAAAGGANLGMGTDIADVLARRSYEASLPYEQARINKRYDILQNLSLPVERDIAGRNISYAGEFLPRVAGAEYTSSQGTALAVQNLKDAAAKQDWQTALQIMQSLSLPAQVQQQILSGAVSIEGALAALNEQATYHGVYDQFGMPITQPQYFNQGQPPFPPPTRYRVNNLTTTGTAPSLAADNSPITVNPRYSTAGTPGVRYSAIDDAYQRQTGFYPDQDPNFSAEAYARLAGGARGSTFAYDQSGMPIMTAPSEFQEG
jgi:hypothetical protein